MSSSEESHDDTVPCVLITSCDDSFKGEELVRGAFDSIQNYFAIGFKLNEAKLLLAQQRSICAAVTLI